MRRGSDLPVGCLGSLTVHGALLASSLLWVAVRYGVQPGPAIFRVELVADARCADVVAPEVSDGARLSEPEPLAETPPTPEEIELPLEPCEPITMERAAVPIQPVPPRKRLEVATSPSPSEQTVEGMSDVDQSATDEGAEATPDYLLNPAPRYPEAARRRGVEGVVLLEVLVLSDGTAGMVRVATPSGSGLLDAAALEAVRAWRFRPATRAGVTVDSTVTIPIRFRLEAR